jgi:hypothetical protein
VNLERAMGEHGRFGGHYVQVCDSSARKPMKVIRENLGIGTCGYDCHHY